MNVVLVPHLNGIERECEDSLRRLQDVKIYRKGGCSAIDLARSEMISRTLQDGFESMLFVDADISFNPADALKLFESSEPVISGVYAKKSKPEIASVFEANEVPFGPHVKELYPLRYAAAGFLRIKATVLTKMVEELKLPLCNTQWGQGFWPFFLPLILPQPDGKFHYLSEDWAFSERLRQIGIKPMADTSIELLHWGRHGFSWGDALEKKKCYQRHTR